jgi:hypothetical protein
VVSTGISFPSFERFRTMLVSSLFSVHDIFNYCIISSTLKCDNKLLKAMILWRWPDLGSLALKTWGPTHVNSNRRRLYLRHASSLPFETLLPIFRFGEKLSRRCFNYGCGRFSLLVARDSPMARGWSIISRVASPLLQSRDNHLHSHGPGAKLMRLFISC